MSEVKVSILAKKGDGTAFKGDNSEWYNVEGSALEELKTVAKGDEVNLTIEGTGYKKKVVKIVKTGTAKPVEKKEEPKEEKPTPKYACKVCGKELKDDRFEVCYTCNQKGLKPPKEEKENKGTTGDSTYQEKSKNTESMKYGSPEDVAGKEVGCAFGVAGNAVSGHYLDAKPEELAQAIVIIAKRVLEAMRSLK